MWPPQRSAQVQVAIDVLVSLHAKMEHDSHAQMWGSGCSANLDEWLETLTTIIKVLKADR